MGGTILVRVLFLILERERGRVKQVLREDFKSWDRAHEIWTENRRRSQKRPSPIWEPKTNFLKPTIAKMWNFGKRKQIIIAVQKRTAYQDSRALRKNKGVRFWLG